MDKIEGLTKKSLRSSKLLYKWRWIASTKLVHHSLIAIFSVTLSMIMITTMRIILQLWLWFQFFFPNIPFTNFVIALQRVQTIKGFIPCQREPFRTSASLSLQYKKTRYVGCAICFLDNLQGMQIDSDRLRIKLCLYMCTKQQLLHLRRLHVRDKNNKNRIYLSSVSH